MIDHISQRYQGGVIHIMQISHIIKTYLTYFAVIAEKVGELVRTGLSLQ